MKKNNINRNNSVNAMTFAIFAGIISVFGITSCQQDDELYSAPSQKPEETMAENTAAPDSVFVNNSVFQYDNMGVRTADQYIPNVDFGFKDNGLQTRVGLHPYAINLVNFVAEKAFGKDLGGLLNPVLTNILSDSSGPNTMSVLADISSKIDNATNLIEQLSRSTQNAEVARNYNEQMDRYRGLQHNNCSYFSAYMRNVSDGNMEAAQKTLDLWKDVLVNGSDIATATFNYISAIPTLRTLNGNMCITDIYDYWVYQTTPWEHMGYEKREQLRLADICVCTTGYLLARTLHEQNYNYGGMEKIKELDEAFSKFQAFYAKHYNFTRHDNLICQIQGAHIVFEKELMNSDIYNHTWFPQGTHFNVKDFMYGEDNRTSDQVIASSLSQKEIEAICNYYAARNNLLEKNLLDEDEVQKIESFEDILREAGFDMANLEGGKKHVIPLNEGCWWEWEGLFNRNAILRYNKVAVVSNKLAETCKKDWQVGLMWVRDKSYYVGGRFISKHVDYEPIEHWHEYTSHDSQYLHFFIKNRYNGMNPD